MKIAMYAKAPDATEVYRVRIPAKYLEAQGHEVRLGYAERNQIMPTGGVRVADVAWADIVVFQRPVTPPVQKVIEIIRQKFPTKPIVGDYDDDYHSVPKWNPGYPHVKMFEASMQAMLKVFDGVIASTDPLREVLAERAKPGAIVETIGNGFDFEQFDPLTPMDPIEIASPSLVNGKLRPAFTVDTQQFNEICRDRTVVAWAGSKFHYVDLDWLPGEIAKVCKLTEDIVFLFVGYIQGNIVKACPPNRLFTSRGHTPITEFYRFLKSIKIDIMLAPLDPCQFNRSKSNLKVLEAMALGAYPICSAWDPYELDFDADLQDDGELDSVHGRLVSYEPGAWAKTIMDTSEKLKDPAFKRRAARENDGYVRSTHAAELRTSRYLDFFQKVIDKKQGENA